MTVAEIIKVRGLSRVLHFTTSDGLLGMLADPPPRLLPRAKLAENLHLEFILRLNAPTRTDIDWFEYSSLSISEVNRYFFKYSLGNHPDAFWVVLEFSEEILTHPGVYFASTNNIYPDVVRGQNGEGLSALFASSIKNDRLRSGWLRRFDNLPKDCPTDNQAEVLYPGALSFDFLKKIHVPNEVGFRLVTAQLATCRCVYEVVISPEHFTI